ncbi:MAG: Inositol oxygenase [Candidatus Midichloria mitochondrii]|nr:hypothetical protein [Candidatus Midichloria mitochondrii]MDJ1256697.1 hypothetical protein [Candidatus Midichloria mitochondrii]MDJ1288410.1 hypothetical protein [Candidatus Midichloria mitochondrii]MDJ1299254.1 hypothetical protein [Candidatus Midichloria mitochondrii]MDJ1313375.1 hypothetical protein [Candidatus Midichloria mitochondrii]MDJ1583960.1 hypothetical protein [Candidatus Midichloria mitochondrii]
MLENARDINEMLRENRSVEWLKEKFEIPRDEDYFLDIRRNYLEEINQRDEGDTALTQVTSPVEDCVDKEQLSLLYNQDYQLLPLCNEDF